jgi:glycine/D-amino acid oxidase-like deaminating enzyme
VPVDLREGQPMHAATGTTRYVCAMRDRRGGQVNPLGYARGLAQAAVQAGAAVHGATPALEVKRNGRWQVRTPTGTVRADKLVLATNGYTDDIWRGLRRSVVPVFSGIAASEPLPQAPMQSVLYELGRVTVYYRFDHANRLLMGGRSAQRDISQPQELRYLIRYAERLWPEVRGARWTHAWSGQLAITPDHYPRVHEPDESVLVCLGYNGRGVAMSTAMGPQLAKRVVGGSKAQIDMPITTMKEIPFHALSRSAVKARMVYGRIRDWLGL